ncbi:WD40-repeat-containing domain [Pseudocohnilembus persalinus]|uniref:WD40-repeat-containing domain n=1 Tax=Pseudocohnilembus persalinus TaxID=266149 RepID=A0A0V0R231_PSEPJ|nr:WD40-repeat-containing domain [Pseudocohnilembus persalinus]|eukprot:KRX08232.1 WD40-repeat-containing domain [Pseudocohnilembus persalinus]
MESQSTASESSVNLDFDSSSSKSTASQQTHIQTKYKKNQYQTPYYQFHNNKAVNFSQSTQKPCFTKKKVNTELQQKLTQKTKNKASDDFFVSQQNKNIYFGSCVKNLNSIFTSDFDSNIYDKNCKQEEKKGKNNCCSSQDALEDLFSTDLVINTKKQFKKQKPSVTSDRYVPLRNNQNNEIILSNAHEINQIPNNNNFQTYYNENLLPSYFEQEEQQHIKISDLYKDHILNCRIQQKIEQNYTFKNANLMKFNHQMDTILDQENNIINKQQTALFEKSEIFENFNQKGKKINKIPYKVLDAPALQDDFYLNLIDWSTQNVLAVGLSSCVYLWSASNSRVTKLCDLGLQDSITSVGWSQKGPHLAIGTNKGDIQIWDGVKNKLVRTMTGHQARIGTVAWNSQTLTSGSRDKTILHRDIRSPTNYIQKLTGHKQEVCGLKWSFDEQQLASGGNDNKLFIWNQHSQNPIVKFNNHQAAVKALTWSPHQHGLLVSGGGTADRTIRFWNTLEQKQINSIDTGSQVCNLIFSKNVNQLVSTHGYSQNQVIVWDYPQMEKIATLTGHTFRVLYLAMSPDGETIVTGAGDETLRFWTVFESNNKNDEYDRSLLQIKNNYLR